MKRHKTGSHEHGLLSTALASATLLSLAIGTQTASADQRPVSIQNGVYVSILSPASNATFNGDAKQVEISAFYQASVNTGGITTLELFIDGQRSAVKRLDAPEMRGVVSFLLTPGTLTPGSHQIVVRVSATDEEIASAKTSLSFTGSDPLPMAADPSADTSTSSAPQVTIQTPAENASVEGTVDIKVDAHDDSGKAPYVSLFIDHSFKTLRNFPPFDFQWDTTHVANGYHTIEVWGYNDQQVVGHADPLRVLVNNPGGRTYVRTDLSDSVASSPSVVAPAIHRIPKKPAAPVSEIVRAVRSAPALAKGSSAEYAAQQRLASNETGDANGVSDQSLLMSPFLRSQTPHFAPQAAPAVVKPAAVAPKVTKVAPTLAAGESADYRASQKLAGSGSTDDASVSDPTQLVAPDTTAATTVAAPRPAAKSVAEALHTIYRFTAPNVLMKTTVSPRLAQVPVAQHPSNQKLAEGNASDSAISPDMQLAAPFLRSSSIAAARDQAPVAPMTKSRPAAVPAVHHNAMSPAVLASTASAPARSPVVLSKVASAAVPAQDLFTGSSSLQTPNLASSRAAEAPLHRVAVPERTGFTQHAMREVRGSYEVVMNNRAVTMDQPLQERHSLLFAPFRQIFESQGGVLFWLPSTQEVRAVSSTRDIRMTIGSTTASVNDQSFELSQSPYLLDGRTMVPLAFLPAALNVTVSFDPITGHVVINSKD